MGQVRADGYDECAVRVLYRYGGGMRLGERRWRDATIDGGVYEIYEYSEVFNSLMAQFFAS